MRFVIIFLCIQSFALFAIEASSCPKSEESHLNPVDLRSELGPIRDQDSVGWCFAFTSADLLTQYLAQTKQLKSSPTDFSKMVSPVGVASWFNKEYFKNYYKKIKNLNSEELKDYNQKMADAMGMEGKTWDELSVVPEGGILSRCLEDTYKNGYCLEEEVPSESFSIVLEKLCREKNICAETLLELLTLLYDGAGANKKDVDNLCQMKALIQASYPKVPISAIDKILKKTSREKIFYDLAALSCTKKIKAKKPFVISRTVNLEKRENNDRLFSEMDKILDSGKMVGLSYYAGFLLREEAGLSLSHASSVVGKFYDKNDCEIKYIIRNSWGPACGQYLEETPELSDCLAQAALLPMGEGRLESERKCAVKFPYKKRNPHVTCDPQDGYLYVSKTELKKFAKGISYISQ